MEALTIQLINYCHIHCSFRLNFAGICMVLVFQRFFFCLFYVSVSVPVFFFYYCQSVIRSVTNSGTVLFL